MLHCPPLRERVYRGKPSAAVHAVARIPIIRADYKQWPEWSMKKAVDAVTVQKLSIRRAAEQYSIPKSTLGDRVSGRVQFGAVSGPPKYLTSMEEEELAIFLCRCGAMGFARSKSEIIALVQRVLDSRNKQVIVTNGWWESFQRRHPKLTLRTPAPLSQVRSKATDPEMLARYFDLLEETLVANGLEGRPGQIFNMDESGMPLDAKAPKLIFGKGSYASAIGSGDKSQITIVGCVNATGFSLPPMVIWDRKHLAPELAVGEVPGTIYGLSAKGWIDHELFDVWFNNHFLRYAPSARPLLLLMDGHSSHYCPDTIKLAAEQQVILFTLPPNTTHLSQPLDKGCFGPLKAKWKCVCHEHCTANPGKVVTRYEFIHLFCKAWMGSMTISNIISGFKTGIYPVNRHALLDPIEATLSLTARTGLAYIPLYSPSARCTKSCTTCENESFSADSQSSIDSKEELRDEQLELFEKWYNEGIEMTDNSEYNAWLAQFHPMSPAASHVWMRDYQSTGVSSYLSYPSPLCKVPTVHPKSCGRVLTSQENIGQRRKATREGEERAEKKQQKEAVDMVLKLLLVSLTLTWFQFLPFSMQAHAQCSLLVPTTTPHCARCTEYRHVLHSMRAHSSKSKPPERVCEKTTSSSHTNYWYLSTARET